MKVAEVSNGNYRASPARSIASLVPSSLLSARLHTRVMAYTAAGMYGLAVLDGAVEGFLPAARPFATTPVIVSLVIVAVLLSVGPRVLRYGLAMLGPVGAGLVAWAVATTPGAGDGAVLYALPVLWTTLFFGRRGAITIVWCVGVAHAIALLCLRSGSAYAGRWIDVMASVCGVAFVVLVLERGNDILAARLIDEARTDVLTGLLNRRGFEERVSVALAHARRAGSPVAVAVFDIDHFKHVNDRWGHGIGDRVLGRVGELLLGECRDIDVVARLGGEEFGVLLPGVDEAEVDAFTRRVRSRLATSEPIGLPLVQVSSGTLVGGADSSIEAMLHGADVALYEAKRAGRNRTVASGHHTDGLDKSPSRL